MPKCSFCKKQYEIPRGLTIVMNDGSVKYFCSSKCRKNTILGRETTKWISKMKHNIEEETKEEMQEKG